MSGGPTGPATCYLHFRSPYSWLAVRRIAAEEIPVDPIVFFSVPKSMSNQGPSGGNAARLAYIAEDVARLARRSGHPLVWPDPFDTDWLRVAAAVEYARQQGRVLPFVVAGFRRRWEEGRDLGNQDTLAAVAGDAGLDAAGALAAMDDEMWQDRAKAAVVPAREEGIFGVPFFVYRGEKFWGQDRIDLLKEAMGV